MSIVPCGRQLKTTFVLHIIRVLGESFATKGCCRWGPRPRWPGAQLNTTLLLSLLGLELLEPVFTTSSWLFFFVFPLSEEDPDERLARLQTYTKHRSYRSQNSNVATAHSVFILSALMTSWYNSDRSIPFSSRLNCVLS